MFVYCHLELVKRDCGAIAREFHSRFSADHVLLHGEEVRALQGLASPSHVASDSTARIFTEHRMPVRCCQYTFDLLVKYLHQANLMALLAILNAHIVVTITEGDPAPNVDERDNAAKSVITGKGPPSKTDAFNASTQGRWGILEDSIEVQALDEMEEEKAREEKEREKGTGGGGGTGAGGVDGEGREEGGGEGAREGGEKDKPTPTKKAKKDAAKAEDADGKETADAEPGPTIVPSNIPVPELSYHTKLEALEDIRYRVSLGPSAMPSVAFYTFTHAHKHLNCATTSSDAALVAGGFSDSVVRVWDMNKSVPGGTDKYETDPESRARKAAREAGLDAPAAERGEGGGGADVEMTTATDTAAVTAATAATDTATAAGAAEKKTNRHAKVASPVPCLEFVGHSAAVHGVSFSPGNEFLLSCARDASVRVWSMELQICLGAYKSHNYPVWDARWCGTGHYFATASHDQTARVWAMDTPQPRRIMVGHLADVDCVAWHPNTNYIATGSADRTVRLWDVQTGECVRIFTGHRGGVRALAMSPDGQSMASGSDDGGVLVWDLGTSKATHAFTGHRGAVYSMDYSGGNGKVLASGGADETVRLWDVSGRGGVAGVSEAGGLAGAGANNKGGAMRTLRTKSTPVCAVQFTRRNLLLAMGARAPPTQSKP